MKKQLLFLAFTVATSLFSLKAQTKVYDFSNDTATWPISAGIGTSDIVKNGLGLHPIATNTNFAAITNSSQATFSDGYVATGNRLQTNGGGSPTAGTFTPTQRYFFVQVDAGCTVKAWYKSGSGGAVRTVNVSNGGSVLYGSVATVPTASPVDSAILTVNVPVAGTFYIYTDAAINFYKIEVSGANVTTTLASNTLATNDVKAKNPSKIYTTAGVVHVSNITADSKVSVFTSDGRLVKSVDTKTSTDLPLKAGFYIVNIVSEKGTLSQKVLVK
ncbi:T9SS type A sorting domain-containing protein [Halpernia frigidisoli]|uniref:Por secretion system C-terminal sorting domain-containing protein n=1 Tax=Halpernia frigidisoli TaxID=1125876 RepID=A0A1I3IVX5_9FLAO|nr:T9SS type A sorting domain-containing protein [Halpernia frigidisoli]SFI52057.1 Por secretion system C-terminal sorting domain-containing protein [Halpernia frigidisoli]